MIRTCRDVATCQRVGRGPRLGFAVAVLPLTNASKRPRNAPAKLTRRLRPMSRVGLTLRAHPSESLPSESAHVRGATNHLRHRARGARPAGTSPIPRGHFNESINQSALIPALSSGTALTLTSLGRRAPITRPPRRTKTFNYQTTDQLPHPSKSLRVGPTANSSDATSLFITAFCLLGEVCSSVKALVVIATQNFHGSSVHRRRVRQFYVVKMIGNCMRRL